ncbi:MAG: tetratricopeptide repeat protein [Sedimenticola sp.]
MRRVFSSSALALLLVACTSVPEKTSSPEKAPEGGERPASADQPFERPTSPAAELDSEIVFNALAGEVAAQRGELDLAYRHLLQAAELSGDAKAAERAARLAVYLKRNDLAVKAIARWSELSPNDMAARQLGAAVALKQGDLEFAYSQLKAIIVISQAKEQDGFLHAMAAVSHEKNHEAAIGLLQRLAAEYPDDPRGVYVVALSALMNKSYGVAEINAERLIEQHPDWVKGYVLLSRIHIARENKQAARKVLAEAVAKYPQDQLLRSSYARTLLDAGEKALAYQQFEVLETQSPDDENVLFALGVLALDMKRYRDARTHFNRLRELGKRADDAAYYLGRVEESEQRTSKAISWYKKVHKGELAYDAQVRIAQMMALQGKVADARDWLKGLRIRMPERSVQLYLVEVDVLREHVSSKEIMSIYDEGLTAHENNQDLLYSRALYAVTIDRLDILERDLRKVISLNPKHADALNALGYTLTDQTSRHDEAFKLISRALKLKPDAPAILDSMGWVHFRLGNLEQALDYLERAMKALPDSEIAAHLGEVLWVTGERARARKVWQEALESDPGSKYILETMKRLTE